MKNTSENKAPNVSSNQAIPESPVVEAVAAPLNDQQPRFAVAQARANQDIQNPREDVQIADNQINSCDEFFRVSNEFLGLCAGINICTVGAALCFSGCNPSWPIVGYVLAGCNGMLILGSRTNGQLDECRNAMRLVITEHGDRLPDIVQRFLQIRPLPEAERVYAVIPRENNGILDVVRTFNQDEALNHQNAAIFPQNQLTQTIDVLRDLGVQGRISEDNSVLILSRTRAQSLGIESGNDDVVIRIAPDRMVEVLDSLNRTQENSNIAPKSQAMSR